MSENIRLSKIIIIDYGTGNLLSVKRAFEFCGVQVKLTDDPKEITQASRLVLPGVGAYTSAMNRLKILNLINPIKEAAQKKIPLLGICLGMQLLFDESEEFGITSGLSIISGRVISLPTVSIDKKKLKIPYIGWSKIFYDSNEIFEKNNLIHSVSLHDAFYFVHSFMATPSQKDILSAYYLYGGHKILAAFQYENFIGCQFHPEKSGVPGLKILKNFMNL